MQATRRTTPMPLGAEKCTDCAGTGQYRGHGYVENGVFKGFTGPCYRCNQKGFQTKEDRKRNAYYDTKVRRFHL